MPFNNPKLNRVRLYRNEVNLSEIGAQYSKIHIAMHDPVSGYFID